ncbi:AMP-binding protein [Streptomyces sp. NPDC058751]|uniref:AMP-binding protein n=1 Tax=Streptomyces sp. NPDC058751 TaxID=3346623 RepID=UPI00368BF283
MSVEHVPVGEQRVDELVAGWMDTTPSAEAIVCGVERITYGELGRLVDTEADRLRRAGLGDGGLAAVALDRPVAALVAMLGVLRAGGAYLPLDPAAPREELHRVLADADPSVVLTRELYRVAVEDRPHRRVVCVDAEAGPGDEDGTMPHADGARDTPSARGATACVLLTAGTTGPPGLVPVSHHALATARNAWEQVYGSGAHDRHVHTAPPESAGFTEGWVRALGSGGTLILPDDEHHDPVARGTALWRLIANEEVTVLACGVPTARLLTAQEPPRTTRLRLVTVTGDTWYLDEQRALKDGLGGDVRVVNAYTVTEAFGAGACFELPGTRQPSESGSEPVSLIGVPLPGTYLTVGGHAPEERGPIVLNGVRTGDEGRIRDDGLLEFLGRRQGAYAAAERALHGHPDVREGLVAEVETKNPRDVKVVAYAVPVEGRGLDPVDVHRHVCLAARRDEWPHAVVSVGSLPRTRADKVDRRNLPLPVGTGKVLGGKGGTTGPAPSGPQAGCVVVGILFLVALFALPAWGFTDILWPYSTDLSDVPERYADRFRFLYFCENVSFGAGMAFLLVGRPGMARIGHTGWFTTAAHLSVVWLLAAWWPQDNFYRLTGKEEWGSQAVLVYTFNVSLMIAAAVVAAFVAVTPKWRRRPVR